MKVRCIWCHRADGSVREVTLPMIDRWGGNPIPRPFPVHAEHEDALRRFAALANRNGRRFILGTVGVAVAMLLVPIGAVAFGLAPSLGRIATGSGTTLLGVMIVVWPFATPETVGMMGIERSVRLVRVVGVVFTLAGLAMAAFLP